MTRVAVIGHVEWCEFVRVPHVPAAGEIVHSSGCREEAGGGGAVAAGQLAKLAGGADFFTALADDDLACRARQQLEGLGVRVHAGWRPGAQRRAFVHLDDDGERTITVIGERLVPRGDDPLPWQRLAELDGVYFTGGDGTALSHARQARVLVATPRASTALLEASVPLDVLVRSANDPGEQLDPERLDPPPAYVVSTRGGKGGDWTANDGRTGTWASATLPGPRVDSYGAGDSFAAGLTFGLAAGLEIDAALDLAARCGAAAMVGWGVYDSQLTSADQWPPATPG